MYVVITAKRIAYIAVPTNITPHAKNCCGAESAAGVMSP